MHITLCQGTLCWSVCTAEVFILIEGLSWCCIILVVKVEISTRWCFATPINLKKKEKEKKNPQTNLKPQCILWVGVNICVLSFLKGSEADNDADIIQQ